MFYFFTFYTRFFLKKNIALNQALLRKGSLLEENGLRSVTLADAGQRAVVLT